MLNREGIHERGEDPESVHRQAFRGPQLPHPVHRSQRLVQGDQVTDPAIVACGAPESEIRQATGVDRDARRRGHHFQSRCLVELTVELGPPGLPQRFHQIQHLVGALAALGERLAEQVELLLAPTDADTEFHPATGQARGRADRLGRRVRVTHGRDVDGRDEFQPGGHLSKRSDQHPRIEPIRERRPTPFSILGIRVWRRQRLQVHHVVRDRHALVAEFVCCPGYFDDLACLKKSTAHVKLHFGSCSRAHIGMMKTPSASAVGPSASLMNPRA